VKPDDWLGSPVGASHITSIKNAIWGDTWVGVIATGPVVLERSEAYLPGWRATALNKNNDDTVQLPSNGPVSFKGHGAQGGVDRAFPLSRALH